MFNFLRRLIIATVKMFNQIDSKLKQNRPEDSEVILRILYQNRFRPVL